MYEKPFYRLKELIIDKYGAEKFETGCTLVARWVSSQIRVAVVNAAWVQRMSETRDGKNPIYQLTEEEAKALKDLFKLQSSRELYTLPETTPSLFKII